MHGGSDSGDLRNDVEGGIGTCATAARAKKWKWQRRELEWGTHVGGVDGGEGVSIPASSRAGLGDINAIRDGDGADIRNAVCSGFGQGL